LQVVLVDTKAILNLVTAQTPKLWRQLVNTQRLPTASKAQGKSTDTSACVEVYPIGLQSQKGTNTQGSVVDKKFTNSIDIRDGVADHPEKLVEGATGRKVATGQFFVSATQGGKRTPRVMGVTLARGCGCICREPHGRREVRLGGKELQFVHSLSLIVGLVVRHDGGVGI
jgi:hypothetical protein